MVIGDDELANHRAKIKNMATGETTEVDLEDDLSKFLYDQELQELSGALDSGEVSPELLGNLLK